MHTRTQEQQRSNSIIINPRQPIPRTKAFIYIIVKDQPQWQTQLCTPFLWKGFFVRYSETDSRRYCLQSGQRAIRMIYYHYSCEITCNCTCTYHTMDTHTLYKLNTKKKRNKNIHCKHE